MINKILKMEHINLGAYESKDFWNNFSKDYIEKYILGLSENEIEKEVQDSGNNSIEEYKMEWLDYIHQTGYINYFIDKLGLEKVHEIIRKNKDSIHIQNIIKDFNI